MLEPNKLPDNETASASKRLFNRIKSFVSLTVADIKLSVTEKITLILSGIALAMVIFAFVSVAALFFSGAIVHLLADYIPIGWAYAIMCLVNLLLALVVILLRKPLIINPVARLLSRVLLK